MINFISTHINPRNRELLGKDGKEKGMPSTANLRVCRTPTGCGEHPLACSWQQTLTLYCFGAVSPGWCYGLPWWLFYPCCGSVPWRRCCAGCSVWECRVWKRSSASHARHSWRASGSSRGPATKHASGNTSWAFPPCPSNRPTLRPGQSSFIIITDCPKRDKALQGGISKHLQLPPRCSQRQRTRSGVGGTLFSAAKPWAQGHLLEGFTETSHFQL